MPTPASRLLEVLELLQSRPVVSGREIADHLGVDGRTVRRYIDNLQELGIPVEGQRGVGGGYRLQPGYRLPPLMLSDDEVVMVVIGLAAARRLGLDAGGDHPESALEKIHRVLPTTLRRRVEALEAAVAFTSSETAGVPVEAEVLLLVSDAIRRRHRLRTAYTSFSGERSDRELSPYGLVVHSGRWYLAAHDHGREALRTFRVDRMAAVSMTTGSGGSRPRKGSTPSPTSRTRSRACPGAGRSRWCSSSRSQRRPRGSRRRSPSSSMRARARRRCCACASSRSTGWRACWPGSAATSPSSQPPELRQSVAALADRLGQVARGPIALNS